MYHIEYKNNNNVSRKTDTTDITKIYTDTYAKPAQSLADFLGITYTLGAQQVPSMA